MPTVAPLLLLSASLVVLFTATAWLSEDEASSTKLVMTTPAKTVSPVVPNSSPSHPTPNWHLDGVVFSSNPHQEVAILRISQNEIRRVSKGDSIDGWMVVRLSSQDVELEKDGARFTVALNQPVVQRNTESTKRLTRPVGYPGAIVTGTPGVD